jgi:diguanylate cyclase (GGDEF)-like protein
MLDTQVSGRVLVATGEKERTRFQDMFSQGQLSGWEAVLTSCWERARFACEFDPPDVILVDASLCSEKDIAGLVRLTRKNIPSIFLGPEDPGLILAALTQGAHQWLPRDFALEHPSVLALTLQQAVRNQPSSSQTRGRSREGADCRNQITQLANLLWEVTPTEGQPHWFTQRYILERLEEELSRVRRYGGPLSIVLGEIDPGLPEPIDPDQGSEARRWSSRLILEHKRRADVVGQYGLFGFLMVLPRVDAEEARHCCQRLKRGLERPANRPFPHLLIHFGHASYVPSCPTMQRLLAQAEENLERGKQQHEVRSPQAPQRRESRWETLELAQASL